MRRLSTPSRESLLPAVVLFMMGGAALAQDAIDIPDPEPTGQAPSADEPMEFGLDSAEHWFKVKTQYAPSGSIGSGEVNTSRSSGELGVMIPFARRNRLWIVFNSEYVNSNFKSIHEFTEDGNLYSDLLEHSITVRSMTHLSGPWSLLLGGTAKSAGEAHAEIDQSLTYRGAAGLSYQVNPNLQIGLMAAVATRLEDDTVFFPFPIVELNYTFDERWRAEISAFSGAKVVYAPSQTLDLFVSADWHYTEYRLDHDGPFEGGVFQQTRVPLSVGANWRFKPQFTLSASVGMNVLNDWKFVDSVGEDLFETDVETDVFASFGIRLNF